MEARKIDEAEGDYSAQDDPQNNNQGALERNSLRIVPNLVDNTRKTYDDFSQKLRGERCQDQLNFIKKLEAGKIYLRTEIAGILDFIEETIRETPIGYVHSVRFTDSCAFQDIHTFFGTNLMRYGGTGLITQSNPLTFLESSEEENDSAYALKISGLVLALRDHFHKHFSKTGEGLTSALNKDLFPDFLFEEHFD